MLMRISVSGGSYQDWQEAQYEKVKYRQALTPIFAGGISKEVVFQEVVSNSSSGDDPLGTLAGRGITRKGQNGGHIVVKVDEPSIIMGIASITPRVDYSQGNRWFTTALETWNDLHVPSLDGIGFQELLMEKMAWWATFWDSSSQIWVQKSAGKQPAWLDYMTNYNRTYGNFARVTDEMFMTLNRRYEPETAGYPIIEIKDQTTYIDPAKYNFIFAQTARDAQNYWVQIAVNITARRLMSGKIMPNL